MAKEKFSPEIKPSDIEEKRETEKKIDDQQDITLLYTHTREKKSKRYRCSSYTGEKGTIITYLMKESKQRTYTHY